MRKPRSLLEDERWTSSTTGLAGGVCAAYPGSYAEAGSSLGFHFALVLGGAPSFGRAQRTFSPKDEPLMRGSGLASPLRMIESGRGVAGARAILFSIACELQVAAVLEMLSSSGLEVLSGKRERRDPLVVMGGACARTSPEILVPFADAVVSGEGEEAMGEIVGALADGAGKGEAIERLRALGCVAAVEEDIESIEQFRAPEGTPPVSSAYVTPRSVFGSMFLVEVMRGCPHGCTFCIMSSAGRGGALFFPAEKVLASIPPWVKRVGLVGASVLDHPEVDLILAEIAARGLEMGLSSMRAAGIDEERARMLARGRVRAATISIDAPSERIGRAVRKPTKRRHVIEAAANLKKAGINKVKLYALVGFEGEGERDYGELADLCRELASIVKLTLSVAPVVPKRFTGLAGARFMTRREYRLAAAFMRKRLGGRASLKIRSWRAAELEYLLSHCRSGEASRLLPVRTR